MTVTGVGYANTGGEIQIGISILIIKVCPFTAYCQQVAAA
jgi:hypothetical protein